MAKLLLNVSTVSTTPNFKVNVGLQPYSKEVLDQARQEHVGNYFFKRGGEDGASILAIPLKEHLPFIGDRTEEYELAKAPWLLAPLTIEGLLSFFAAKGRPILKRRPLRILSAQPNNILLAHPSLPKWLQRRLVLNFETRTIKGREQEHSVILACGVGTRTIIDAPCANLLADRFILTGKYVSVWTQSDDLRMSDYLQLAGRVREIQGTRLILDDHGDRPSSIELSEAYLEPSRSNFADCVRHFVGEHESARILEETESTASRILSGPERLDLIKRTFDYIGKQNIDLVPGASMRLDPLAGTTRHSWSFRVEAIQKPVLVFDPSGTKTDRWNERGIDQNGPFDQRTFAPKQLRIAVVCQAMHEGQVDAFIAKFLDGLPEIKTGSGDWARTPYAKGFIRRYALEAPKVRVFSTKSSSINDYVLACREAIEAATDGGFEWSLAIVQIDQDFKELEDAENPYFGVKAVFLKHRVPVQEITLETMRFSDQQLVFAMNNMSVATYSKVGGIPWLLKSNPTVAHELVVGIGSQTMSNSRLGTKERVVGITTLFSSDGKYILDDRTGAVPFSQYKEELKKSLVRSIESVRTTDNWRSTDAVRLVFHVFKQMADAEAEAVAELVEDLGLTQVKFAFLHLVDAHPFTIFDDAQAGIRRRDGAKGAKVPERGVVISLSDSETLLCLTGPKDLKQARHGMPQPMLLRLHRRSTFRDMTYLTRQVFDFSCHSWRMFTPAPTPITIHYSELIARLLSGLRHVPTWDADTMLGPISRTRWFL
ncbi:argonaute/piwi family protein [Bradyrhizobium oligotrophicum]|uniref:argonaute/piwi family protein n=1 Tax=Bradyrhizobium oligotrophicum TaxID=44255 RepID=UPI003EC0904E